MKFGALVQLVRIHACHAWGHGFESRTHRILGGLAQLARASALHAEGQRFESVILHTSREGKRIFDMLDIKKKKQVERA